MNQQVTINQKGLLKRVREEKIDVLIEELDAKNIDSEKIKEINRMVGEYTNDRDSFYAILGGISEYNSIKRHDEIRLFYFILHSNMH
tara:strand:- start:581 stop:841 length:261 start_codon:yes stop_codon:yes gene_type:complete